MESKNVEASSPIVDSLTFIGECNKTGGFAGSEEKEPKAQMHSYIGMMSK